VVSAEGIEPSILARYFFEKSGMIVIPASLRSDFIHMAGMTIHIALESTIHIVGIRTWPPKSPSAFY
jgi:hypothetical protein